MAKRLKTLFVITTVIFIFQFTHNIYKLLQISWRILETGALFGQKIKTSISLISNPDYNFGIGP